MVGVAEDDHGRTARRGPRDLDGVLDGLRTGGEQRRLLGVVTRREPVERRRDVDEALVLGDEEAGVGEALRLLGDAADDLGVGRPDAGHGDAGRQVDDVVAVDVDEDAAAGALDEHRHRGAETARQLGPPLLLQLERLGSRDGGRENATLIGLGHRSSVESWSRRR